MNRISEWLKIRALSGHFQRYPHRDCSGKLKEVSSSVWAAARWGWLYYISIYFPQYLSNFSQARLMACSVSDNLKLCGGPLHGIRRDYEFYLLRKWTVCPNAMSQPLLCSLSNCGFDQTVCSLSTHIGKQACKIELLKHLRETIIWIWNTLMFEFCLLLPKIWLHNPLHLLGSSFIFLFPPQLSHSSFHVQLIHFPPTYHLVFHTAI